MVIMDDPAGPAIAQDLLPGARAGDADAFCRLIEPLQAPLLRQAILLCGDPTAAEDLVSETLVAAWKSIPRYNETCRLSTWLHAILLHRHQKAMRRARSRPKVLAWLPFFQADKLEAQHREQASTEPSPAETAAQKDAFAHVRRCIERLPEKHRQVVWLRFFEDSSLQDIAIALGCSIGTVKSRLHHALEKLSAMNVKNLNLHGVRGDE
jgi:RNA polymerase sigma-70 factor (ECF subfamily)